MFLFFFDFLNEIFALTYLFLLKYIVHCFLKFA